METEKETFGVWIGCLTEDITSEDLFNEFKSYGPICNVRIQKTKDGKSRGFGFVNFYSREVAEVAATDMNEAFIKGNQIRTNFQDATFKGQGTKDLRPLTDCEYFMQGKSCPVTGKQKCCFRHNNEVRKQKETCENWLKKCFTDVSCKKRHPSKAPQLHRCKSHDQFKCFKNCGDEKCPMRHYIDLKALQQHIADNKIAKQKTSSMSSVPVHPQTVNEKIEHVGIYWDIENCSVPSGKCPQAIVAKIREQLLVGKKLVEFICVCDSRKQPEKVINELTKAEVTVVHVSATAKNAADDKLKGFLTSFGQGNKPPATVVLVSGDVNFAPVLYDLRYKCNLNVVLLHNTQASPTLKQFAHTCILFDEFISCVPLMKNSQSTRSSKLRITNIPLNTSDALITKRLSILSSNCGGVVENIQPNKNDVICYMRFPDPDAAYRAYKRLKGQEVNGNKINCILEEQSTGDDFSNKVVELLQEFPHWLSLNGFANKFKRKYQDDCNLFRLEKLKNLIYIDGKPGRKFVCLREAQIQNTRIGMEQEQFYKQLVEILTEHNRKVPFASLLGIFWSYNGVKLLNSSAGIPLDKLVSSCPNLFMSSSRFGVAINKKNQARTSRKAFESDVSNILQQMPHHEVNIDNLADTYMRFYGSPLYIGQYGSSNIEDVLAAFPLEMFSIEEKSGVKTLALSDTYKSQLLHDQICEVVGQRNCNQLDLKRLPVEFFKFHGRQIPHDRNPNRLKRLVLSLKGHLRVFSANDKRAIIKLIQEPDVQNSSNVQFQKFKKGLVQVLASKPGRRMPLSDIDAEYTAFHGSCPNLSYFGLSPVEFIKALETEIMVEMHHNVQFCCLKLGKKQSLSYTRMKDGDYKSALTRFQKFKKGLIEVLATKPEGRIPSRDIETAYTAFHGDCPKLSDLGLHPLDSVKALGDEIELKWYDKVEYACLSAPQVAKKQSLWDELVGTLFDSKEGAVLLSQLKDSFQQNADQILAIKPDFVKVIGHKKSKCLMLSSKYDELLSDDDVMAVCKLLYLSPGFVLPGNELLGKLGGETDGKDVLRNALASDNVKVTNGQVTLDQNIALRFFAYETLMVLEEIPDYSTNIHAFCGQYHKKFNKQFRKVDFGFKAVESIIEAMPKEIIEIQAGPSHANNKSFGPGNIGKFLIEARQILKRNNDAVLQCQFGDFYASQYGKFNFKDSGFSSLAKVLANFPEFFSVIDTIYSKEKLIVLRESFVDMPDGTQTVKKSKKKNKKTSAEATSNVVKNKLEIHEFPQHPSSGSLISNTSSNEDLVITENEGKLVGKGKKKKCKALLENMSSVAREESATLKVPVERSFESLFDKSSSDEDSVIIESEEFLIDMPELEWCEGSQKNSQQESDVDLLEFSDSESIHDPDWWVVDEIPDSLPLPLIDMNISENPAEKPLAEDSSTVFDLIKFDEEHDDPKESESHLSWSEAPIERRT